MGSIQKDLEQHMKLSFSLRSSACENTETIKPSEAWHIAPTITDFRREVCRSGKFWEEMWGDRIKPNEISLIQTVYAQITIIFPSSAVCIGDKGADICLQHTQNALK